jgi:RimJ/RimL family protein N-acetyltransferase
MAGRRLFDATYHEELPLPDGRLMRLRLVRPEDRAGVEAGFTQLSPESRFHRWFHAKSQLTDADLNEVLASGDGRHLALAAVALGADGNEEGGIGIARYVRTPEDSSTAEFAITVVDAWQGRGIGRILLHRLLAAMREDGIRTAIGRTHVENQRIRRLLEPYVPPGSFTRDGAVLSVRFPVPEADDPLMAQLATHAAAIVRLFRRIAAGALSPLERVEKQLDAIAPMARLEELRRRDRDEG